MSEPTTDRITKIREVAGELARALCDLANIAEDWNDAAEETDERGRGNSAIGLIVFDNGSGYIAQFQQSPTGPLDNGHIEHQFGSPEEAEDWFKENVSDRTLL